MHEKIYARLNVDYEGILGETLIFQGKDINEQQIENAIKEYLANTRFQEMLLSNFEVNYTQEMLSKWLKICKDAHPALTIEYPEYDELLEVGTFRTDHKRSQYTFLELNYHRRYLENE